MTGTAIAPVRIRLTPRRRIELAQRLMYLVGPALLLRHPASDRLVRLRADQFYYPRTDGVLLRALANITALIKSRAEDGIELPPYYADVRVSSGLPRELVTVVGQWQDGDPCTCGRDGEAI